MFKDQNLVIVGGGLVGALLGRLLALYGARVTIYERRSDPSQRQGASGDRSINLALASRGIQALKKAQVFDELKSLLLPMRGRMVHDLSGAENFQLYGQKPEEVIYSVSRRELNTTLLNFAKATGNVAVHFDHRLLDVDFDRKILFFDHQGQTVTRSYDQLFGCDGVNSSIRECMVKKAGAKAIVDELQHGYKELTIPARNGDFALGNDALHIWPRRDFMLIALPNPDASFTATLFLANAGSPGFADLIDADAVKEFFTNYFPDVLHLIPDLPETFLRNPLGRLPSVHCDLWHVGDSVLLLGDAAHGIVPFHGQGMNCGFEDCSYFIKLIEEQGGWTGPLFMQGRKRDADAIAEMALENYQEMRSSVLSKDFLLKKEIAFQLEARFPSRFIPRYSMVMFHTLPYSQALSRGKVQEGILTELANDSSRGIDWIKAQHLVESQLPQLI